ncbi:MAG: S41 family peptidase [Bacteroidota bacterium]|nr:S41 family peptidase [Bacteroidota bacterium]MDP3146545.1 S41 family peptidase [Bacteroidota bacterium]
MNRLFLSFLLLSNFIFSQNVDSPLWMRYPSISPDGKQIVFSFKGDLYKVDANGGAASVLTLSEGHDFMPVWSPDGKWIAFASDRYGNYDVYIMSSTGGSAKRLTHYSSPDYPYCFSPDGSQIYFGSTRVDINTSVVFPSGRLPELYSVPVIGGKESMVSSWPMEDVKLDATGTKFLYHDKKGGEDPWRKHHTSSITRDIWMYDKTADSYTKLTDFEGEDRTPILQKNDDVFYLSEKSGAYNIWKFNLKEPATKTQITKYEKNPVRFLSSSKDGVLCFGFDGEIYTMQNGEAKKVSISIITDERFNQQQNFVKNSGATEMSVSPNGKEVAFVLRGEIFVTSIEGGTTKRITNTPQQERSVSFSNDGRSLVYAAERNNIWGIYQTSIGRKEENNFFNSTLLNEETLVKTGKESFQPKYSPDATEVAFLEDRTAIKILNIKSKAVREILPATKNYSYSDGDQWFDWSPDGKYLLVNYLEDNNWLTQVGLIETTGKGKLINLSQSGYDNSNPKWMADGKMMIWFSNRHGMKNHASHGAQADVYGQFFDQKFYERFKLTNDEYLILKETEEKDKKKEGDKTANSKTLTPQPKEIKIDFEGLLDRKERLTMHSSDLSDALIANNGEQLYYLCKYEKGFDIWVHSFKDNETKLFLKLGAPSASDLSIDKEGKNLFLLADGKLLKIAIDKKEKKEIAFKADMELKTVEERAYFFEHIWRQVNNKFYVTNLQGTDWDYYKKQYAKFLPYINNNRDFAEMLSEFLGELNASHTGCRANPKFENPDETAALGVYYDESYTGKGMKIIEVMDKSPLQNITTQIKEGTIIEKIDGVIIDHAIVNYWDLLNRKNNKTILLSLIDSKSGKRWEETVKPISLAEQNELMYQRWIKNRQKETEKLSAGKLGFMHVKAMNNDGFRAFYEQVLGKYPNKDALIVDTRFNGGGWLHDDLATFLSGKKYIEFVPRERKIGVEPGNKWRQPSAVLISEGNYSDAHMFPVVYKTLGIGKLIGMPVAGTGTAVWWENLQDKELTFGIPQVGVVDNNGKYYENTELVPDIQQTLDPKLALKGRDQQLEKAVEELMKGVKK